MTAASLELGLAIVNAAESRGCQARLLGGLAVAASCPSATTIPALSRAYGDVDLAILHEHGLLLTEVLAEFGFLPSRRFNALHRKTRLLYYNEAQVHLDVFVDAFAQCHRLPLRNRLARVPTTLTPADLLLTKLQIAQLNFKDAQDLAALLLDKELTTDDAGIDVDYVTRGVLAGDWGWWRTVSDNLELLVRLINADLALEPAERALIERRATELRTRTEAQPKSLRWRARSRIGDRLPWREEPEEIKEV